MRARALRARDRHRTHAPFEQMTLTMPVSSSRFKNTAAELSLVVVDS
jgi:hypothetical protein